MPTWRFCGRAGRGAARVIDDAAWLLANVSALTDQQEGRRTKPWAVSDAPEKLHRQPAQGQIVGIEIEIAVLEGKFKASQNRPEADRAGVAEGLLGEADPHAQPMRELVKSRGGVSGVKLPSAGGGSGGLEGFPCGRTTVTPRPPP